MYNFRLGLIQKLMRQGYKVVVIAPKDEFTSKLIALGVEYRDVKIQNYGTNPFSELGLIYRLYQLYKEIQPDLIFHYTIKPNIYGSFAAKLCGIPSFIITTGLGHLFEFKNMVVRWVTLFLYKIACKLSEETWFLNTNDMDIFTYKGIVKKEKARVIKSEGINVQWFKPYSDKVESGVTTFLFAGRLLKEKGIVEYVNAAKIVRKKYPNTVFNILGFIDESNPNSIPYQELLEWHKKKIVHYLGDTVDVRPHLQKADCLVFPSYYREGVSRILMESASMETPIITTDNVGCRDVVEHGSTGFICTPKDVSNLCEAIVQFIEMEQDDRALMGKLGRRKMVKEYDERNIIKVYLDTIGRYSYHALQKVKQGTSH
jgi:glycosyltransferase involved in cell wall biosynthesis